jgi:hypothetical protein
VFLAARRARAAVWGTTALYSLATAVLFLQAMAGRPAAAGDVRGARTHERAYMA